MLRVQSFPPRLRDGRKTQKFKIGYGMFVRVAARVWPIEPAILTVELPESLYRVIDPSNIALTEALNIFIRGLGIVLDSDSPWETSEELKGNIIIVTVPVISSAQFLSGMGD